MNVAAYLRRIRYNGPFTPSPEVLRALHVAHMQTVPFENLDIHLGQTIILDQELLFEKIVRRNRGGFCYELNGMFGLLLRALGFDVTFLFAGVYSGGKPGPEFDHMALMVDCGKRWLADVGFGDSFVEPLLLDVSDEQPQGGMTYRIDPDGGFKRVMRKDAEVWIPSYRFTLQPRSLDDFVPMCDWQQTSPDSHFTQKRICSKATPEGRITLSEQRLIITTGETRNERELSSVEDCTEALRVHFGIDERYPVRKAL